MKKPRVFFVLSLVLLLSMAGLSQKPTQSNKGGAGATSSSSPTPTPTPAPDKVLNEIKETIERYNAGDEAGAHEQTTNFTFKDCDKDCNNCTVTWNFVTYEDTETPGAARKSETSKVSVPLKAIDPKLLYVEGTRVQFRTNNGATISVTIEENSKRAPRRPNDPRKPGEPEKTSSWRIEVRDEEGAKAVVNSLKKVLGESCKKP